MANPVVLPRPDFPCPCLTKKLTVIGTMGQTHGTTNANRPRRRGARRNGIKPCWAFWAISLWTLGADDEVEPAAAPPGGEALVEAAEEGGDEGGSVLATAGAFDDGPGRL